MFVVGAQARKIRPKRQGRYDRGFRRDIHTKFSCLVALLLLHFACALSVLFAFAANVHKRHKGRCKSLTSAHNVSCSSPEASASVSPPQPISMVLRRNRSTSSQTRRRRHCMRAWARCWSELNGQIEFHFRPGEHIQPYPSPRRVPS